jgi:hypothetical protein
VGRGLIRLMLRAWHSTIRPRVVSSCPLLLRLVPWVRCMSRRRRSPLTVGLGCGCLVSVGSFACMSAHHAIAAPDAEATYLHIRGAVVVLVEERPVVP